MWKFCSILASNFKFFLAGMPPDPHSMLEHLLHTVILAPFSKTCTSAPEL